MAKIDLGRVVGKSAYEIAVDNGYEGTEQEWLASMNYDDDINSLQENKVDKVDGKQLSSNDFTDEEKTKLASLSNYDDTDLKELINDKVEKVSGKGLSTNDFTNTYKTKLDGLSNYDDTSVKNSINTINGKIPAQASSTNQLADKDFVNSSIATATSEFVGTFNSLNELKATTKSYDNNDYAFVIGKDSAGNTQYSRYKWNGSSWIFEYVLNNSSFTSEQWKAINSNVTDEWRQSVNTSISNKVEKVSGKGLSTNDYTTAEKNKLAGLSNYDDSALKTLINGKASTTHTHTEYASNSHTHDDRYYTESEIDTKLNSPLPWGFNYLQTGYSKDLQYRKIGEGYFNYSDNVNWSYYSEIEMIHHNSNGVFERGTVFVNLRGRGSTINDKRVYFHSLSGGITNLSKTKINYKIDTTNKRIYLEILAYCYSNYTNILFRNSLTRIADMLYTANNFWTFAANDNYTQSSTTMQAGATSGYTEIYLSVVSIDKDGNDISTTYATKTELNDKANSSHSHDDRYYTETEINNLLKNKSDTTHTHSNYHDKSQFNFKNFGHAYGTDRYVTVSSNDTFSGVEINIGYSGKWFFATPGGIPFYLGEDNYAQYGLNGWAWDSSYTHLYLRFNGWRNISITAPNANLVNISDWTTTAPSGVTFRTDEYNLKAKINDKADTTHTHSNYVEKESGKGLSSNDFTTDLKLKLESLSNNSGNDGEYDDSALIESINDLQNQINDKANSSHSHDDRYYTETEINNLLKNKSDTTHTHTEYASNSHTHDDRYYTETEIDTKLNEKLNKNSPSVSIALNAIKNTASSYMNMWTKIASCKITGQYNIASLSLEITQSRTSNNTNSFWKGNIHLYTQNELTSVPIYTFICTEKVGYLAEDCIKILIHKLTDISGKPYLQCDMYLKSPNSVWLTGYFTALFNQGWTLLSNQDYVSELPSADLVLTPTFISKASHDKDGNDIANTYATKTELSGKADSSHTHSNYVEKISGKGLSTNDFTDEDKEKLDELNNYDDSALKTLLNGKANTSHNHDDRYYTESEINNLLKNKSDTSHTHSDYATKTELNNKVDKVSGKGLSTNDFTNTDKSNLDTLKSTVSSLQSTIRNLQDKIDDLEDRISDIEWQIR